MQVGGEAFLIINTGLTAFSLYLSARMMRRKPGKRLFIAATLSSLYTLAALYLKSPLLLSVPACVLCAFFSVWLAFSKENGYDRFRLSAYALGAGLLLSGLSGFFYNHGLGALLSVSAAAILVMLAAILLRTPAPPVTFCTHAEIGLNGCLVRVSAILDSGNLLTDPITNLPAVVVSRHLLYPLLPLPENSRFISIRTATGRGRMSVFTPDSLRVEINGIWQVANGVVGIAPENYHGIHALVPAALFEGGLMPCKR